MTEPWDDTIDYHLFAEAMIELLNLRSEVRFNWIEIEFNPKGQVNAPMLFWFLAHAPPEAVAEATRRARKPSRP